MHMRSQDAVRTVMAAGLFACAALFAVPPAWADDAPRSYIAAPDVYKVIAENNGTWVVLATWKPGQRDQWHSHPRTGVYFLTDCETRVHLPDGKFTDASRKVGFAVAQPPIPSHSFENRSDGECRAIIVEQD